MSFGVAFIGLDHWYTAFLYMNEIARSAETPLVGIADPDAGRRAEVRGKYPQAMVTEDADALLARDDVALVAITASTDQAPPIAERALAAGKHVLSVKPAARTLAELEKVVAAAERAGRFYGSFEGMRRLTPQLTLLRDLVRRGEIGRPMAFYQLAHGGLPQPWPQTQGDSWWLHPDKAPGGAWIDHAIYAVDQARFVFDGEIDHAAGIVENRVHKDLAVEDYGAAVLRLAPRDGGPSVSLIFEDTWTAGPGGGVHWQEIIGTAGTLRPRGKEWVLVQGGKETTRHPVPDAAQSGMETLARMLQDGQTPPFGPADARANLAACFAFYEAAKQGAA